VPDALELAGYRVERHGAHFLPAAEDAEFIPIIGQHADWIMLTHDGRQRYNPDERDAVMRSGVPHFIHVGKLKHEDLAASFVLLAPRLMRFREKHGRPFIAKVYRPEIKSPYRTVPGAIKMVLTPEMWLAERKQIG